MNSPPSPELPHGRVAPYTRGEVITLWLCWFTPGIAAGMFVAIFIRWFLKIFTPQPWWHGLILLGAIALVLAACAGFAAFIQVGKSGRGKFARRLAKSILFFILAQLFVTPLVGWLALYLILGP